VAVSNCIECSYTDESGGLEFQNEMAISIAKGETCQGRERKPLCPRRRSWRQPVSSE